MKSLTRFDYKVINTNKYPNRIDEIIEKDWHNKAANLQERRWRKIHKLERRSANLF